LFCTVYSPQGGRDETGMGISRLIIVCGVPGSGKSTLALRAVERWGATSFASETFADKLGAAARTASGDLSKEAIAYAYSAMEAAVAASLATGKLVLAVGSFRSGEQRRRFASLGADDRASVITLRVTCPVATAAERVRARMAMGERGPAEEAIRQIDDELNRADGIDAMLANDTSIEAFHRRIDTLLQVLERTTDRHASTSVIVRRFAELTGDERVLVKGTNELKAGMKTN
jgi:predicted kinase